VWLRLREKLFGSDSVSKNRAKNRLQFVLVQDRAGLTNEELGQFKREMIQVIEKYFVIDEKGFDISYKRGDDSTTLLINSPIIVKRQEALNNIVGAKHNKKNNSAKETRVG